jgi:hypothetical protein
VPLQRQQHHHDGNHQRYQQLLWNLPRPAFKPGDVARSASLSHTSCTPVTLQAFLAGASLMPFEQCRAGVVSIGDGAAGGTCGCDGVINVQGAALAPAVASCCALLVSLTRPSLSSPSTLAITFQGS